MKAAGNGGYLKLRCLKISCNCLIAVERSGSVRFGACLASA